MGPQLDSKHLPFQVIYKFRPYNILDLIMGHFCISIALHQFFDLIMGVLI